MNDFKWRYIYGRVNGFVPIYFKQQDSNYWTNCLGICFLRILYNKSKSKGFLI